MRSNGRSSLTPRHSFSGQMPARLRSLSCAVGASTQFRPDHLPCGPSSKRGTACWPAPLRQQIIAGTPCLGLNASVRLFTRPRQGHDAALPDWRTTVPLARFRSTFSAQAMVNRQCKKFARSIAAALPLQRPAATSAMESDPPETATATRENPVRPSKMPVKAICAFSSQHASIQPAHASWLPRPVEILCQQMPSAAQA